MAFAPMGPEASFFEVLDRHRASLLATLRIGCGETPGRGTHLASRYRNGLRAPGSPGVFSPSWPEAAL
jgi:hypothetical protein